MQKTDDWVRIQMQSYVHYFSTLFSIFPTERSKITFIELLFFIFIIQL